MRAESLSAWPQVRGLGLHDTTGTGQPAAMGQLDGQSAIVAGGATGPGSRIATALAEAGARVLIADPDADAAERMARRLGGLALGTDFTRETEVAALAYHVSDSLEEADILVNAVPCPAPARPSPADFDRLTALALRPLCLVLHHLVPAMAERGSGLVLNVAPVLASPIWGAAVSAWTGAATRALAAELEPAGLRVNALVPGSGPAADPGPSALALCVRPDATDVILDYRPKAD